MIKKKFSLLIFKRPAGGLSYEPIVLISMLFISFFFLAACAKTNTEYKRVNKKYLYLKKLSKDKNTHKFLDAYWKARAHEGIPPRKWPKLQKSLSSSSCMACHYDQYAEWKKSRMAHSMDAGVVGQLLLKKMTSKHWKPWAMSCLSCHSPLAEYYIKYNKYKGLNKKEKNILRNGTKGEKAMVTALNALKIPMAGGTLSVSCAACHVRYYHRFGPDVEKYMKQGKIAHGGFIPAKAFTKSYFCIKCHQFPQDNRRLKGKLFENTYGEWKKSIYAAKGISCETCHTPQGSMAFKSIYNKNFVLKAITIHLKKVKVHSGKVTTTLSLTNSGVGHDFPTYTTPKVILSIAQEKAGGNIIRKSIKRYIIGWSVSLNLKKQYFDTRLKPFQTAKLIYDYPLLEDSKYIRAWVTVKPESHYTRFFKAFLKIKTLPKIIKIIFSSALKEDVHSKYLLWEKRVGA